MGFLKSVLKNLRITRLARKARKSTIIVIDNMGKAIFSFFGVLPVKAFKKTPLEAEIKKILIVRLDRIGDMIITTPAIRAIRFGYPKAKIDILINEYTKPILAENPYVDRILIWGGNGKSERYDLAIAFSQGFKSNLAVFYSKSKYKFGFSGHGGSFLLNYRVEDDRGIRPRHEIDFALRLAFLAGGKFKGRDLDVFESKESVIFAEGYLKENKLSGRFVIIHPGSRQDYIRWPKEKFVEVCDLLIKECDVGLILIGRGKEEKLLKEIASLMREKCLIASDLELKQVISLIKRCSLFLGNSSGPMHIAAALKVPVVSIFGPKHPFDNSLAWGHRGEKQIVIEKDPLCANCHPGDCFDYKCLDKVSVEEVFDVCRRIIAN